MVQYQPKPGLYDVEFDGQGRVVTAADQTVAIISEDAFQALFEVASDAPTPEPEPQPDQPTEPVEDSPAAHDYIEVHAGDNGEFYWHRQAANGRLIASGGEGFTRKFDAEQAGLRANPGVKLRTDLG